MQFDAASIFLGGTVLRPCESNLVELGNSTERIPEAYYCFPLLEGYETEPFSRDDYDQFPSDLVIAETFYERFVDVITVFDSDAVLVAAVYARVALVAAVDDSYAATVVIAVAAVVVAAVGIVAGVVDTDVVASGSVAVEFDVASVAGVLQCPVPSTHVEDVFTVVALSKLVDAASLGLMVSQKIIDDLLSLHRNRVSVHHDR